MVLYTIAILPHIAREDQRCIFRGGKVMLQSYIYRSRIVVVQNNIA